MTNFDDDQFENLKKEGRQPRYERGWRFYENDHGGRVFERAAEKCIKAPAREPGPNLTYAQRLWFDVTTGRENKDEALRIFFEAGKVDDIATMPAEMFSALFQFLSSLPVGQSESAWLEAPPLSQSMLELHAFDFDSDRVVLNQRARAEQLYRASEARLQRENPL